MRFFFLKREKADFSDRFKIILELWHPWWRCWMIFARRFYPSMGSAKWQRHTRPSILGVLWGTASFTSQGFVGVRRFWFNGVVYSRELFGRHKYRCAFLLASNGTGFIPSLLWGVLYIAVRQEEVLRNLLSQGVLSSDNDGKFCFKSDYRNYIPFQLCFLKIRGLRVLIFLEINDILFMLLN